MKFALLNGYYDSARYLAQQRPSSDFTDTTECMYLVAELGVDGVLPLMESAGWDLSVEVLADGRYSLLHYSAKHGNANICQELIDLGFSLDQVDCYGNTPLIHAVGRSVNSLTAEERASALMVAKVLLANGADPDRGTPSGMSPLTYLCNGKNDLPFVVLLLRFGASANSTYNGGVGPLHMAIRRPDENRPQDKLAIISELLKYGANPNQYCQIGFYGISELRTHKYNAPPIVKAIFQDDPELLELLIEYGADIVSPVRTSQYGSWYPLDYAVKFNRCRAEEILLRYGATGSQ